MGATLFADTSFLPGGLFSGAFIGGVLLFMSMILTLVRLYSGPTVYDRVLALNVFGTQTVLFIGILGFINGRPDFLDIALLYALINFVGTIAILKFFRYRALGDAPTRSNADPDAISRSKRHDGESSL